MPLKTSYVERLEDVLGPAREFLSRAGDLFARPRIVVPTAGAKAWLASELARTLGASPGAGGAGQPMGDGIVANVEISYPGTILGLLQPPRGIEPDPWSFDRLTFTVLDVITGPGAADLGIPFDVGREPLLAARRIAGFFDNYHVRRPGMILRWEQGHAHLSPVATNARDKDGDWAADALNAGDAWQFRVWRAVRDRIGTPSPTSRAGFTSSPSGQQESSGRAAPPLPAKIACPQPVLVAGLQSLSLAQLTALRTLGATTDVHAILVHPSATLRSHWAATTPPVSLDVPPPRPPAELPEDLDPLVATWLHGARETQILLASQGITPTHERPPAGPVESAGPEASSLLVRLQGSIRTAAKPEPQKHELASDSSVTIHRCHTLSRQAEVLHDALLHAFHDLHDLRPHDVVIVSPCLDRLAPHLEAVFARAVVGRDGRTVKLPLLVADRGLHELSDAAQLLIDVMRLVGSRCSVEDFLAVAEHPLVTGHLRIDDDMTRCWDGLIERTTIHWGFDAAQRVREELPAEAAEPHTWRAGIERMLLGAVLPPATGGHESQATIPLEHVPLGSLAAIATLAQIHEVVRTLDDACHDSSATRPVAEWCAAIEEAMFGLCGPDAGDLAEPLRAVRQLRDAASATPVPFHDVRTLLEESLTSIVGRQPLRTGAITATSMVPLRDVPFRVVCIAGYDDRAVSVAESPGDDLAARQQIAGDGDPRIDTRRALLDCALAARDRLLVTCTGMDIRTNKSLPLVTPLSELVDFAIRHGVRPAGGDEPSGIEIRHPRHAVGRRNFEPGAVQPGRCWSHDPTALAASQGLGLDAPLPVTRVAALADVPVIELALLEEMVRNPLALYLKKSLGVSTWRDDEEFPAATFPLTLSSTQSRTLAESLLRHRVDRGGSADEWIREARATGRIPFGRYGDESLREIVALVDGIISLAANPADPVPLRGLSAMPIRLHIAGKLLSGTLKGYHPDPAGAADDLLVDVRVTRGERDTWDRPLHIAALRLLVAWASGSTPQRAVVIARHQNWKPPVFPGPAAIQRTVILADALRDRAAAAERLAGICALLPQALATPCSRFGGTLASIAEKLAANDEAGARQAFANYVGYSHAGSNEALVYGTSPRFEDIFVPGAPELAFHAAFEQLFTIGAGYTLS